MAPKAAQQLPRLAGTFAIVWEWLHVVFRSPARPSVTIPLPATSGPPIPTFFSSEPASVTPSRQLLLVPKLLAFSLLLPLCDGQPPISAPPASLPAP